MTVKLLINIDVDDVARGISLYTAAFDLRLGRRLGDDFVELLGASSVLYLLLKKQSSMPFPGATAARDFRRHWTPVHLDFVVDDVDAAVTRAVAAGARLEVAARDEPYGRLAMLADPFGNGVCVLAFTAQGYDAIATAAPESP